MADNPYSNIVSTSIAAGATGATTAAILATSTTIIIGEAVPWCIGTTVTTTLSTAASASAAGPVGVIVAAVILAAGIAEIISEIEAQKDAETNAARFRDMENSINILKRQQTVLSNQLRAQLNAASRISPVVNLQPLYNLKMPIIQEQLMSLPTISKSQVPSLKVHTVKSGETLSGIAQQYGTTWQKLWSLNKGALKSGNPNLIFPNETIVIPTFTAVNQNGRILRTAKSPLQTKAIVGYNWNSTQSISPFGVTSSAESPSDYIPTSQRATYTPIGTETDAIVPRELWINGGKGNAIAAGIVDEIYSQVTGLIDLLTGVAKMAYAYGTPIPYEYHAILIRTETERKLKLFWELVTHKGELVQLYHAVEDQISELWGELSGEKGGQEQTYEITRKLLLLASLIYGAGELTSMAKGENVWAKLSVKLKELPQRLKSMSIVEKEKLLSKITKARNLLNTERLGKEAANLITELRAKGIKITDSKVLKIGRNTERKIVWLEEGGVNPRTGKPSGFFHVIEEHIQEFVKAGIPENEIADFVFRAATKGKKVGERVSPKGIRDIFEIVYKGKRYRVAIQIGDNGYIIGANMRSLKL